MSIGFETGIGCRIHEKLTYKKENWRKCQSVLKTGLGESCTRAAKRILDGIKELIDRRDHVVRRIDGQTWKTKNECMNESMLYA